MHVLRVLQETHSTDVKSFQHAIFVLELLLSYRYADLFSFWSFDLAHLITFPDAGAPMRKSLAFRALKSLMGFCGK